MNSKNFFGIICGVVLALQAQVSADSYYTAAVVEFNPSLLYSENLKRYENLIAEASKQEADIIVFPEGGLFAPSSFSVPDPKSHIAPCDNPNFSDVVYRLSCAARTNKIYVVANIKEQRKIIDSNGKDKVVTYNTNAVFDRNGVVVARYAKYNLFDEMATDKPEVSEPVFFTTDFGVTFGTFICFDIMFQEPTLRLARQYGVTDFVFSTFWFSEMPFLTAYQVQQGWAEVNNVNLLASGVNKPELGSTGSGIYNGKWGPLVVSFEDNNATKLLVARVKKIRNLEECGVAPIARPSFSNVILDFTKKNKGVSGPIELSLLHDQIYLFNSENVTIGSTYDSQVCSENNFCCSFKVKVDKIGTDDYRYSYRAVAFDGVRMFGKTFRGGVQSCGLILCQGPRLVDCTSRVTNISDIFRFTEIEIKGTFLSKNSMQIPSTLIGKPQLESLPPNKYIFKAEEKGSQSKVITMELLWPVTNLQTFAIWGRNFVRDGEELAPISAGSSVHRSLLLLCLGFLGSLTTLF